MKDLIPKEPETYKQALPSPSFNTKPADRELTAEVKSATGIMDSLFTSHEGSSYQLHVFVDKAANFVPVGIQLIDDATHTQVSMENLTVKPRNSVCFGQSRFKSAYETAGLPLQPSLYNSDEKSINLLVKTNSELFLVTGLNVSGRCFEAVE